jgi:acetylglutamate kinase
MEELSIIKVGGKVVEEAESLKKLLDDFSGVAGKKILVHGGGRSATALAAKLGIETKMVDGRRITDAPMLEVVTMVYGGLVNKNIVAGLQARKVNAIGLTGADMNVVVSDKRAKGNIDYGFVGDIRAVDANALDSLLSAGTIPVIAPLSHDGKGSMLNINADTMASTVAVALASKYKVNLVFCFELLGVMKDVSDPSSVINEITPSEYEKLKQDGVIEGGMIPKLDNSFEALRKGVSLVRITSANDFSRGDCGTALRL